VEEGAARRRMVEEVDPLEPQQFLTFVLTTGRTACRSAIRDRADSSEGPAPW
jgi:hypothetical protein